MLKSSSLEKAAGVGCVSMRNKIVLAAALSLVMTGSAAVYANYANPEQATFTTPTLGTPTLNTMNSLGLTPTLGGHNSAIGSGYSISTQQTDGALPYNIPTVNTETGEITNQTYYIVPNGGDYARGRYSYDPEMYDEETQTGPNVVGHFINLPASGTATVGAGIYNNTPSGYSGGILTTVIGDFINDVCAPAAANTSAHGGAIDNHGDIDLIYGDFIGNRITVRDYTKTLPPDGAAIRNGKWVGTIVGNFIGNRAEATGESTTGAYGGAIANHQSGNDDHDGFTARIDNIYANFVGNSASHGGGAVYNTNSAIIANLQGEFIDNTSAYGGGIYNTNQAKILNMGGTLARNSATEDGGAIYNTTNSEMTVDDSVFIANTAANDGGAVYNTAESTITINDSSFKANSANQGGALYNADDSTMIITNGSFSGNTATDKGGALYNASESTVNIAQSSFTENTAENGGAIFNDSVLLDDNNQVVGPSMVIDASFVNNTATGENGRGGAIYSRADIDLVADGHTNRIEGNTSSGSEAIYIESQDIVIPESVDPQTQEVIPEHSIHIKPNLNIIAENNGEWVIQDKINGTAGDYNVNLISTDKTGTVSVYDDLTGADMTVNGVHLNTVNNDIHDYTNVNSFTITGDSTMSVDVDLRNGDMDRFVAAEYGDHEGTLDITGINIVNDVDRNQSIEVAGEGLAESVTLFGGGDGSTHKITTPIRMYDMAYNINNNRGYLNIRSYFNPSILAAPVVMQAGVQSAMNTTWQNAFNHADTYTKIPKFDRLTMMEQGKYADASTDFNTNLTTSLREYNLKENRTSNQGIWFRPYAAFERLPLRHGPKVDSITYGSFIGFDSDFHEHRNGWHSVLSTYLGYNGGQIDYSHVSSNLNGGVIGITDTFYKNNFWTALTLSGGAMFSNTSTMYGHEDATSLYGGLGSKTGYNFEFKDGRYIIQPVLQLGYSFANMFDYTNAAGVKIDSSPMHTIQINPSLRFIANFKSGWQPYARMGMVWNIMGDTDVDAGGYHLPDMYIKPYFEYGLGIQKLYNHRFTGFGETMLRHGGRNGIALTFGFRYGLGREPGEDYKNMTKWEKFKAFFK